MQESEGDGGLPLEGSIPDMTSTTELYLSLQRVYRARADTHCAAVLAHAHASLKTLGRNASEVKMEDARLVCRNARHLRIVRRPPVVRPASEMHVDCLKRVRCLCRGNLPGPATPCTCDLPVAHMVWDGVHDRSIV